MRSLVNTLIIVMLVVSGCSLSLEFSNTSTKSKTQSASSIDYYSDDSINLSSPEQFDIISNLNFSLIGEILRSDIEYFFYQVEDGHGYISTGIVETNNDGIFNTNIEISNPTNSQGAIVFYFDSDNDRKFSIEENVNEEFGRVLIDFSPSIVVPLTE